MTDWTIDPVPEKHESNGTCYVFTGAAALFGAVGLGGAAAAATGIAATTIGGIAGTALAGAGIGALTGAVTGGNIGKDALYGGLAGGALGGVADVAGYSGAGDMLGLTGSSGAGSVANAADYGAASDLPAASAVADGTSVGGGIVQNGVVNGGLLNGYAANDPSVLELAGTNGGDAVTSAQLGAVNSALDSAPANGMSGSGVAGLAKTATGGISNTALGLGALAALGSAFNKPKQAAAPTVANPANTSPLQNASINVTAGALPNSRNPNVPAFVPGQQGYSAPSYYTDPYAGFNYSATAAMGGSTRQIVGRGMSPIAMATGNRPFSTKQGDRYVKGPGDGTSDDIDAKLSDGEFVLDAHEVALIGNGSNDAGARKLNQFREHLVSAAAKHRFLPPDFGDGAINHLARMAHEKAGK